jgi:hypothetical protein
MLSIFVSALLSILGAAFDAFMTSWAGGIRVTGVYCNILNPARNPLCEFDAVVFPCSSYKAAK